MRQIYLLTQKIIEISFYALFFVIPFIFNPGNSELFELPKMYFVYLCTVIILTAWLTKSILVGTLIFKRTTLDIPLLLFFGSQLLATYFSIDQHTSIFGYYSRMNGGLLSTLAYTILYWAYVSNMNSGSTLNTIRCTLFAATIVALWGILEHFGLSPSCFLLKGELNADCWVQDVQSRVFATLGQPNWMAALLVAIFPITLMQVYGIIQKHNYTLLHRSVYFYSSFLIFAAIIFTKSRSGLLGLGASIATIIFFKLPNRLYPRAGYLILVLLSIIFFWHYNFADCFDLNPNQFSKIGGTESCKIRTIVWKGALNIWKNNPIFGTGPETFAYAYYNYRPVEHNNTSEWELLYNKAHNEYLNYLANTGIVGAGAYILLIGSFLIYQVRRIKNRNSYCLIHTSILAGYASILVTNFFGFSTSIVNLLFFLFPAMAVSLSTTGYSAQDIVHRKMGIKNLILLLFVLCSLFYVLLQICKYYQADLQYAKADKYGKKGLYQDAAKEVKNALFIRSNEPLYYNELAETVSFLAVSQGELGETSVSLDLAKLAIDSSTVAGQISPYNINFLKNRSLVFARLSLIDPTYINQAIPPLEEAVRLAPTDPKLHYNLGVLYERAGEKQKAEVMYKKALDLKPDYQEPKEAMQKLQIK